MPPKDKYTDPKLREEVKEEIKEGDKGGQPGQWSARKAQMMASEYKKRGGDYTTDKKDKDQSQQNLTNWGEEDWQTKEGDGKAKKDDGTEKRYLPKKAWEKMSEKEKKETDDKKQKESKEGKQHVSNTDKAKESRRKAQKEDDQEPEEEQPNKEAETKDDKAKTTKQKKEKSSAEPTTRSSRSQTKNAQSKDTETDDKKESEKEDVKSADEPKNSKSAKNSKAGQKRKDTEEHDDSSSKKQKDDSGKTTIGSKHMDATEPGKQGTKDRLPKEGQKVSWKAMPGYVEGEVVEVLKKGKQVDGKQVNASSEEPRIVLKSDKSGKICVHKPEACYYDSE